MSKLDPGRFEDFGSVFSCRTREDDYGLTGGYQRVWVSVAYLFHTLRRTHITLGNTGLFAAD